jgi:mono/diheme cytochrome c family protein
VSRWPILCLCALLTIVAGCEQKMANSPQRKPLDTSPLFADGAAARPELPGTVATDADLTQTPDALPAALPLALLQHGQDRFNVFCSPCHAYDGHGDGRVVQRGFPNPPDLHSPAIVALGDRQIFDVISNGYGVMFPYGGRVPASDRWAIVAYIRTLQYADKVPVADLPPDLIAKLGAVK